MPSLGLGLGLLNSQRIIMMGGAENPPTFTRNSPAYLSDGTQVAANVPRFEQGKFGKAILIEEGTTNLENSWDGWSKSPGSTLTQISDYEYQYTGGVTHGAFLYKFFNYSGKTITFQVEIKGEGDAIGKRARWQSAMIDYYGESVTLTNEYQKLVGTVQFPSDNVAVGISLIEGISSSDVVYLRFKQLEEKPYPTSFIDGTRSPEILAIPTAGVLNPQEGTVECWVYVNPDIHKQDSGWNMIFVVTDSNQANQLRFGYSRDSGKWHVATTNSAGAMWYAVFTVSSGWHHFALTWNQSTTTAKMYVDGIIVAQKTSAPLPSTFASTAHIGSWFSRYQFNSLIDDLRISSRARSDAEILAAYQSGKPAPVDEWTTYKRSFDGHLYRSI